MGDLSVIMSAVFVSFTVIATIFAITKDSSLGSLGITSQNPIFAFLLIFLSCSLLFLILCIGYIRTELYAWTSFKELAYSLEK
jgi:hypothetical protein